MDLKGAALAVVGQTAAGHEASLRRGALELLLDLAFDAGVLSEGSPHEAGPLRSQASQGLQYQVVMRRADRMAQGQQHLDALLLLQDV